MLVLHCDAARLYYTGVAAVQKCSLEYSAFYTSLIIAAVSLHRPIFQLSVSSSHSKPNFRSFGHSPSPA